MVSGAFMAGLFRRLLVLRVEGSTAERRPMPHDIYTLQDYLAGKVNDWHRALPCPKYCGKNPSQRRGSHGVGLEGVGE